jgi:hypothetical protein
MNLFGNKKHPLEEQIRFLGEREQFLDFLDWVAAGRELAISSLPRAPDGRVREISGKIQVYDEILNLSNYQDLLIRRGMRKMQGLPG